MSVMPNRRDLIKQAISLGALTSFPCLAGAQKNSALIYKPIPVSGERLAAIGMGTWITFNVGNDTSARRARSEVLGTFFAAGGQMVDSSPMYGSSEEVLGYCLRRLGTQAQQLFAATKVWTPVAKRGRQQIEDSHRLWQLPRFDLFQVHNLLAWRKHLDTLNGLKKERRIRYVGVTTSHGRRHDELLDIMQGVPLDFVQLTYNVLDREVEKRLLPLALDRGIAVIANRPFQGGTLFDRFAHSALPPWAKEFDCENWAQLFLKFVISHPAVTCAIPATSQVAHMRENMGALSGGLPDAAARGRIIRHLENL